MDLSPVLGRLARTFSSLLPEEMPPLEMYSTNDDFELLAYGRDTYCFFSSTVEIERLPKGFALSNIDEHGTTVGEVLVGCGFSLLSFSLTYYAKRTGRADSIGFRIYAKRTA